MKRGWRAIVESLVLHGLLAGAMIAMAGSLTPQPPTIRLDFCMLEPTRPKPTAPVAAATPAPPPMTKPSPPAPQAAKPVPQPPKPVAAKPRPKPIRPKTVAVKPKPVPAEIKPAPPRPMEPAPEVAAAIPEAAPAPSTPPPAPEASADPRQVTAAASGGAADKQRPVSHPAAGGVEAVEEYRHANFGTIRSSILANLRYPLQARRQGWSGQVEVAFLVAPDGTVSDLRIQASSGFPVLDDQALAAVRRSAPFTPPRIAATLVVPVAFRLN